MMFILRKRTEILPWPNSDPASVFGLARVLFEVIVATPVFHIPRQKRFPQLGISQYYWDFHKRQPQYYRTEKNGKAEYEVVYALHQNTLKSKSSPAERATEKQ